MKKLIGQQLIEQGLITKDNLQEALDVQSESGKKIGDILVELSYISRDILEDILSEDIISLSDITIPQEVFSLITYEYAKKNMLIPIRSDANEVSIAMADAYNFNVTDELKFMLNKEINVIVCNIDEIKDAIVKYYEKKQGKKKEKAKNTQFKQAFDSIAKEIFYNSAQDTPIIKFVSFLITEAYKRRASDIHLESLKEIFRIRFRIDGVLHEIVQPSFRIQSAVISRIKLMAGMDIAEKRMPQDGRMKFNINAGLNEKNILVQELDLRVSTLPGIHGESVVMRILDKSSLLLGLGELGFSKLDVKVFEKLLLLSNGIVLVTGPTGSGKTTTLYSSLNYLNRPDKKIITVEDPVEYQIKGINQVQVKEKINFTFAKALRAILRQSPDIIMIGEIRDVETATITMQASLTGHLVFSTLHTKDAVGAIVRLLDMGLPSYMISSSIQAVLAQRLIRKICENCKVCYKPTELELLTLGIDDLWFQSGQTFYKGEGCDLCSGTGYKGRLGLFELLIIEEKIRNLIFKGASSTEIKNQAQKHEMKTLREDGIRKVLEGVTTIEEVVRVTHVDISDQ